MKKALTIFSIIVLSLIEGLGQSCPTADFTLSDDTPCRLEALGITNTSTDATNYVWDFCSGELHDQIVSSGSYDLTATVDDVRDLEPIEASGNWYNFVVDRGLNTIVRLDYASDLSSNPTSVDLGNLGILSNPTSLRIVQVSSNWYGFVHSSGNATVYRLDFGSSIENTTPTTTVVATSVSGSFTSLAYANDSGDHFLVASHYTSNNFTIIEIGSDITNVPPAEDIMATTGVTGARFSDVSIINGCGNWYGLATGFDGRDLFFLDFGVSIFADPSVTEIGNSVFTSQPARLEIREELDEYIGYVTHFDGTLSRINIGSDLSSPSLTVDPLGAVGTSGQLFALALARTNGQWKGFSSNTTGNIFNLDFPFECGESSSGSTLESPTNINYDSVGTFNVRLEAYDANGAMTSSTMQIVVDTDISNDAMIQSVGQCVSSDVSFNLDNNENIVSYAWDFDNDDITDSTLPNPAYNFSGLGTGSHPVNLTVTSSAGCSEDLIENISIYPTPPTPDFDYSAPSLCSNSEITFTNLTDSTGLEGIIQYSWNFNDESSSSSKDPVYAFSSSGDKTVGLTAMIVGCTTAVYSEDILLADGPMVDFTYSGNCFGQAIQFSDLSTGEDISGFSWHFSDRDSTTTEQHPSYQFIGNGDYVTTLTVSNLSGCTTSSDQDITISDESKVDFSFGEAIENLPVNFIGEDLSLADDMIISWTWDFDGLGTSSEQNPDFTFSNVDTYTIQLSVETSQGCLDSSEQAVNVLEASCPTPQSSLPSSACINELISIQNSSVNASSYSWDFCGGSIENLSNVESIMMVSQFSLPFDFSVVQDDNGIFRLFGTSSVNGNLIRIDSLANDSYQKTDVDLGSLVDDGTGIQIVKEGSNWYGIVSSTSGVIYRLNFGNDITSIPTVETLPGLTALSESRGMDLVYEGSDIYVLNVGGGNSPQLQVIKFTGSITDNVPTEFITDVTGGTYPNAIRVVKECGTWSGVIATGEGGGYTIVFDSGLESSPTIASISGTPNLGGMDLIFRDGNYYAFATDISTFNVIRMNFGNSLSNAPALDDLGNFGSLAFSTSFRFVNSDQNIFGYAIGLFSEDLFEFTFDRDCDLFSVEEIPLAINYSQAGSYDVTLYATDDNNNVVSTTETITVTATTAPAIDFSVDENQCISNPNNFIAIDDGGLTYSWDFTNDGMEDDNVANPEYTFGAAGDFPVRLSVDDGTCTNFVQDTVSIYPVPPVPDFTLSAEPYCTNTPIDFINSTDESAHSGATISYLWDFNGEGTSQETDTTFSFLTDGSKDIALTMSIPGCSTPYLESVSVIPGPANAFSFENDCHGEVSEFTNSTTGDNLTNPFWDFGDGYTTLDYDPSHNYESPGDYMVTLTMENTDGCVSNLMQEIRINGQPQVTFSNDLSCEGQATSFDDTSIPGDDLNNVDSWIWDFAGLGSSTEENPEFLFDTNGNYDVTLTVANEGGCSETATQTVTVRPTPVADFQVDIGCLNDETSFIDLTSTVEENPLQSWFWSIDGEVYTEQNASVAFNQPGQYLANLIVTGTNQCASFLEQQFEIFDLPDVQFEYENACDNEFTVFTDISTSDAGDIVSRTWQFDELGTANGAQSGFYFTESGNYQIMLSVTDELGCANDREDLLTIHPSPESAFNVSSDLGPPPLEVSFFNESDGAEAYLWEFNDPNGNTSTETNPTFSYDAMGIYTASLIASTVEGCSDTSYMEIAVAEPILDLELVQISSNEVNDKINLVLTIRNSGSLHVNGFDIRIDIDGQSSIYESYDDLLPRQTSITYPLNFSLPVTGSNVDFVCVVLEDREEEYEDADPFNNEGCINFEQELVVENTYPNPMEPGSNQLTLNMVLPAKSPVRIVMSNNTGMVVYDQTFADVSSGLNTFLLDMASYRKGMYFLKVSYDNSLSTQKIIRL